MKDFEAGFPEWTELAQDGGLDPLGMQRPIEAIYQSLLPGISTITLRFRYYSFFVWMLEVYAKEDGNTDPENFRFFQRRCETLFALIAARGSSELGVAGIEWAQKQLASVLEPDNGDSLIDFSVGAHPDTEAAERYLRNKGGAFGGIYSTQMYEMGLIMLGDEQNPISVCTSRALPLVDAFASAIGDLGVVFVSTVAAGRVSLADLDRMAPMKPSEIAPGSAEHACLVQVLLGQAAAPSIPDKLRRSTALMLLRTIATVNQVPRAEAVKWAWFETFTTEPDGASGTEDVEALWALYQACDLTRLAYENVLDLALNILHGTEMRRMPLGVLVTEVVELVDMPNSISWSEFSANLVDGAEPVDVAKRANEGMEAARASGDNSAWLRSVLELLAALTMTAQAFGELLNTALNAPEHFRSLKTEVRFLQSQADEDARNVLETLIRERILKRHLWVASRKFRNQKAYTFLMEPEEGVLRFRNRFRLSPSSPRLDQAMRFLRDVKLIEDAGLTELGHAELNAE